MQAGVVELWVGGGGGGGKARSRFAARTARRRDRAVLLGAVPRSVRLARNARAERCPHRKIRRRVRAGLRGTRNSLVEGLWRLQRRAAARRRAAPRGTRGRPRPAMKAAHSAHPTTTGARGRGKAGKQRWKGREKKRQSKGSRERCHGSRNDGKKGDVCEEKGEAKRIYMHKKGKRKLNVQKRCTEGAKKRARKCARKGKKKTCDLFILQSTVV